MGALISLAFTERYQSEIDALAISGAPVNADANVSPALVWLGKVLTHLTPKMHLLPSSGAGILSRDPEIDIAWDNDPLTNKKPMRVRLGVEINNMARDVREHLADLRLPILIMHGADDKLVNPSGSQLAYDQAVVNGQDAQALSGDAPRNHERDRQGSRPRRDRRPGWISTHNRREIARWTYRPVHGG